MADPTNTTAKPKIIERLKDSVDHAHAMLAGVHLEIFTHLAEGPLTAAELADKLGVAEDRLARLLYALAATGLLEVQHGRFTNAPEADAFLVKGRPGYLGGNHEMLNIIWHADLRTAESIRSGRPAALHDFAKVSDEEMAAMMRGGQSNSAADGRYLAHRFDFAQCRSVVDVGGGSGGLVAALCEAHPRLRGTLFDLPRTCALAAPMLRKCPGGDRVTIEAGDILVAPPKEMHDAATMRSVVQVFGPADAARAIAHTAAAVRPGGAVYVVVGVGLLDDDRAGPPSPLFRNVTLMNTYPAGAAYTVGEYVAWLAAAGCGEVQRLTLSPTGNDALRATKLH
jgi:O-methyltransferase/methyltransferase family protein